ncbi:hypothetical protein TCAL_00957 [Tigriopus californicus]|uniref:SET domain-containing protein n=1 Tax=Tigriopus californicus TaxID=6832 RepID=A0A553P7U8_TIGCA|nr:SET domain-containing protein SmydA-8-like [Tigriopus californicus]TRY73768.1 hypothetical protein TCAL_00957 [Tigriopus californicus]|eukprot:TCALIF_00957-PA protein Name:"Similar to msta Protein msta, isoform A (Drosophila melanogaster)" AED:0.06 eAED:0.06 QI:113/1/1/1/0.66/1/4/37/490
MEANIEVVTNDKEGRHLVAIEEFEQGQCLWSEKPILCGPRYSTYPVCLGCYEPVDGTVLCPKCGWPMCSEDCPFLENHTPECKVFQRKNVKVDTSTFKYQEVEPMYDIILPLRVLVLKAQDPTLAKQFFHLESHVTKWKQTKSWNGSHAKIWNYLKDTLSMETSQEEISNIFGILYTNDFLVDTVSGTSNVVAVYRDVSMCSHSCVPNAFKTFGSIQDGFSITLRAKQTIKKAENITISYVETFLPSAIRQEKMEYGKHFTCMCPRCSDPTDLGTFGNSLLCGSNCGGTVSKSKDKNDYKCEKCGRGMTKEIVQKIFNKAFKETEALLKSNSSTVVDLCEMFLSRYKTLLHPNNLLMLKVKYGLITMIGRIPGYQMNCLTLDQIIRKRRLCEDILRVLDVIDPGISSRRGVVLYELHMAQIMAAQLQYANDEIDILSAKEEFEESLRSLQQSIEMLQFEKPESFEGIIYQGAKPTLAPLRQHIQNEFGDL